MAKLILAINPGSTSTKIGAYRDLEPIFSTVIEHNHEELQGFATIASQKDFRLSFVLKAIEEEGLNPKDFDGIVGIGGLLPPIESGGYKVSKKMVDMLTNEVGISAHASNLGAILADLMAKDAGCDAYIYDAVSAGILPDIAKITGFLDIERRSLSHVLNSRAQSIQYAKKIGKNFDELNLIICHLGGGVSLSVYQNGVLKDSIGDDLGPFSSERGGAAPLMDFIDYCYDNNLTKKDAQKSVRGGGGLKAHLGIANFKKVEEMINDGDQKAKLIADAMCYGIAKSIGSMAPVINGKCDAIILTGGMMNSTYVSEAIADRVGFISHVEVMPGEYELEALVAGCLRIINNEEMAKEF